MLQFVSVFFQLGVEIQDGLCSLPNKPGARVRQLQARKKQGSLHGFARVPTVGLAHSIQQLFGCLQVIERLTAKLPPAL
jgi:hypothetical protein